MKPIAPIPIIGSSAESGGPPALTPFEGYVGLEDSDKTSSLTKPLFTISSNTKKILAAGESLAKNYQEFGFLSAEAAKEMANRVSYLKNTANSLINNFPEKISGISQEEQRLVVTVKSPKNVGEIIDALKSAPDDGHPMPVKQLGTCIKINYLDEEKVQREGIYLNSDYAQKPEIYKNKLIRAEKYKADFKWLDFSKKLQSDHPGEESAVAKELRCTFENNFLNPPGRSAKAHGAADRSYLEAFRAVAKIASKFYTANTPYDKALTDAKKHVAKLKEFGLLKEDSK